MQEFPETKHRRARISILRAPVPKSVSSKHKHRPRLPLLPVSAGLQTHQLWLLPGQEKRILLMPPMPRRRGQALGLYHSNSAGNDTQNPSSCGLPCSLHVISLLIEIFANDMSEISLCQYLDITILVRRHLGLPFMLFVMTSMRRPGSGSEDVVQPI